MSKEKITDIDPVDDILKRLQESEQKMLKEMQRDYAETIARDPQYNKVYGVRDMTEKITGVCVDIPTVIKEAKARKQPFDWQYKTVAVTFDASNLTDAERFLIEIGCRVLKDPVPTLANITPNYYKNQRVVPAPAWISVAERLPENSADFVIVSDTNKTTVALRYDDMWIQTGEKIAITHWMKLPAPSNKLL